MRPNSANSTPIIRTFSGQRISRNLQQSRPMKGWLSEICIPISDLACGTRFWFVSDEIHDCIIIVPLVVSHDEHRSHLQFHSDDLDCGGHSVSAVSEHWSPENQKLITV